MKSNIIRGVTASLMVLLMTGVSMILTQNTIEVNAAIPDVTMGNELTIDKKAGTEFIIPININYLSPYGIDSMEITMNIPDVFSVSDVIINSDKVSAKDTSFYLDEKGDKKLRIAIADLSTGELSFNRNTNQTKLLDLKVKVKNDLPDGYEGVISIEKFKYISGSSAWNYDIKSASNVIKTNEKEKMTMTPRLLYTGSDEDLISSNQSAIAIEFTAFPEDIKGLEVVDKDGGVYTLYYNEAFSKKNNKETWLGIFPNNFDMNILKDWNNYKQLSLDKKNEVVFGDMEGNGIDAQDAVTVVSKWLRKIKLNELSPEYSLGKDIIGTNVNGDSMINTSDAIEIVNNYVSKKEFSILSK